MRLNLHWPVSACLLTIALPAVADDTHPAPPTPAMASPAPITTPTPPGSSSHQGPISDSASVPPIMHPGPAPGLPADATIVEAGPLVGEPLSERLRRRSNRETINQFQSSSYWTPPQPYCPHAAPNYSHALAADGGVHIRYPYFKYRAPWTYQGPAGISHTIEWTGWPRW